MGYCANIMILLCYCLFCAKCWTCVITNHYLQQTIDMANENLPSHITTMKIMIILILVPGLMEHDPLPGISTSANVGSIRKLLGATASKRKVSVDDVENSLSNLTFVLRSRAVQPTIIGQLLKQVSSWPRTACCSVVSIALSVLLLYCICIFFSQCSDGIWTLDVLNVVSVVVFKQLQLKV